MPNISKANPSPSGPPKGKGVMERIAPVKASNVGRLRLSLYGRPKVGKTRFACTFPKPLLIIGAEDGTASVVGVKGVEFVQLERTTEFLEIVRGPALDGRWATIVIDTATKLRDMRITEILGLSEVPTQKGFGFAGREQWMECAQNMKDMLRPFLDLPRIKPVNVVVIAQEQNFTGEDGTLMSDLITPSVGSALGKSVCDFVNAECDYVCQMFIREQTVTKEGTLPGQKTPSKVVTKTGKKEFCMRIGPHEVFYTGFRVPLGKPAPPDVLVDPTYAKVIELI